MSQFQRRPGGCHAGGAARSPKAQERPRALRRSLLVAQFARHKPRGPKLGGKITPVTRNRFVGSLGSDGRLKFLSAPTASLQDNPELDLQIPPIQVDLSALANLPLPYIAQPKQYSYAPHSQAARDISANVSEAQIGDAGTTIVFVAGEAAIKIATLPDGGGAVRSALAESTVEAVGRSCGRTRLRAHYSGLAESKYSELPPQRLCERAAADK